MVNWIRWAIPRLLFAATALVAVMVAVNIQAYRDWGFICEYTGSRQGYRQWPLHLRTGHWYKKSPLEEFITTNAPTPPVHRWKSYCGTGKNVFGMSVRFGHGRPGAILWFDQRTQSLWIAHSTPAEIWQLHDLFLSRDQDAIEERIRGIQEEVLLRRLSREE
jgi:hypothetical protein